MDKAPDAFRTISEVADELDIPQHVLRFWETRFAQIKPMKRSGGRRFYRPDDVDLLRGIRRLLYAEGYTIRGVQRILKEQGIKAVQAIDGGTRPLPQAEEPQPRKAASKAVRRTPLPDLDDEPEADDEDAVVAADDEYRPDATSIVVTPPLPKPFTTPLPSLELRLSSGQAVGMVPRSAMPPAPERTPLARPAVAATPPTYLPDITFEPLMPSPRPWPREPDGPPRPAPFDVQRLRPVLDELMAVRRLLDVAMQDGEP